MAKHRKKSPLVTVLLLITIFLVLVVGFMAFTVWQDSQQVFQDLTIELGTTELNIQDFLTPLGSPKRASFVTDPSMIDLTKVGRTSLTLKHGTQKAVVNLIIEDTTPPAAGFLAEYTVNVAEPLPQAGALVSNIIDHSQVRVFYDEEPEISENYTDQEVTIVVEDTSGNSIKGQCLFHYTGWLKDSCNVELGTPLTPELLLTYPDQDAELLSDIDLADFSSALGQKTLTVSAGDSTADCIVTVVDTTAPTLTLNNVQILPGETVEISDFVKSAEDLSGTPQLSFAAELPDLSVAGTHNITIEAKDSSGNVSKAEAILWVSTDRTPPEITGTSKSLTVKLGSTPDFMEDVSATDEEHGECDVFVNTSALDMSKAGTYTIVYYSTDPAGNTAMCERSVTVK